MIRPLIGITCGTSALDKSAKTPQDRLNQTYSQAIWEAGGTPFILPNVDGTTAQHYIPSLDGLLLSGGYDADPALYGEEILNQTVEIDAPRDSAEFPLVHAALRSDIPLFAICRGVQTLNVALGGTLYQDIPAQIPSPIQHRQSESRHARTHSITISPKSRFAQIIGDTQMEVNSFHHQALKDVAASLVIVARAGDRVIEAVENPRARFMLGVQFHPEDLVGDYEKARRLFRAFVEAARKTEGMKG